MSGFSVPKLVVTTDCPTSEAAREAPPPKPLLSNLVPPPLSKQPSRIPPPSTCHQKPIPPSPQQVSDEKERQIHQQYYESDYKKRDSGLLLILVLVNDITWPTVKAVGPTNQKRNGAHQQQGVGWDGNLENIYMEHPSPHLAVPQKRGSKRRWNLNLTCLFAFVMLISMPRNEEEEEDGGDWAGGITTPTPTQERAKMCLTRRHGIPQINQEKLSLLNQEEVFLPAV